MDWRHILVMILILIAGYWLGTKYPGWLTKGTMGVVQG
jgi:hypothetical protein